MNKNNKLVKLDGEILLKKITNVDEAKAFIEELHKKNKLFHFDDDPLDVGCFDVFEAHHVDCRVTEILKMSDWGEHEDCYGYAMHLMYK